MLISRLRTDYSVLQGLTSYNFINPPYQPLNRESSGDYYLQTPTLTPPSLQLPTYPIAPSDIADSLIQYTVTNGIDKKWFSDFMNRGIEIGQVKEISCIYNNSIIENLLNTPENYRLMSDLLNAVDAREDELTACLTTWQKLKYGPALRGFSNELWKNIDFFDGFVARMARLKNISGGKSAVEMFSYFFRTDRVDPEIQLIMRDFHDKLDKIILSEESDTAGNDPIY